VLKNVAGERALLAGWVKAMHENFCFVYTPDYRVDVFAHSKDTDDEEWSALSSSKQVTFELGFTLRGPVALRVRSLGR
jgi:cold shock CspA family protein